MHTHQLHEPERSATTRYTINILAFALAITVVVSLYWLVGQLLTIPYHFLAGGLAEYQSIITHWGPAALALIVCLVLVKHLTPDDQNSRWLLGFRQFLVLVTMPIWLHWLATLLNILGFESLADQLSNHRYLSMFTCLTLTTVIATVVGINWWFVLQQQKKRRAIRRARIFLKLYLLDQLIKSARARQSAETHISVVRRNKKRLENYWKLWFELCNS